MSESTSESSTVQHDVFISYSRNDAEFARLLEKALESYKPPKGLGAPERYLRVFRDESDFTGVEYSESVERHLAASATLVVVCSPSATASEYVNDEIRRFAKLGGQRTIIAILLSGIPNNEATPDEADKRAFPDALVDVLPMPLASNYLDFDPKRNKVNKGQFRDAWHGLLANIYGVSREELEQREEKRKARRMYIGMGASSLIIVLLSIALIVTLLARNEAEEGRLISESGRLANRALLSVTSDFTQALLHAIASVKTARTPGSVDVLRQVVYTAKVEMLLPHGSSISASGYTRTGEHILTIGFDGTVKVWDARSAQIVKNEDLAQKSIRLLAINPKNEMFAISTSDRIYVYTTDTLRKLHEFNVFGAAPVSMAFSPQGDMLIAAVGATTHYWDVTTGSELGSLSGSVITGASPNRKGDMIVSSYADGHNAIVWDVYQKKMVNDFSYSGAVMEASFDPTGEWVAMRGDSGAGVIRIDAREYSRPDILHRGKVNDIEFSPSGLLATAGEDGTVRIWKRAGAFGSDGSWQDLFVGTEHGGAVQFVVFSRSGTRLASVGRSGTIRVWERKTSDGIMSSESWGALTSFSYSSGNIRGVSFNPQGSHLLVSGENAPAAVFLASEDRELFSLRIPYGDIYDAQFSPNGTHLLTHGFMQRPRLWNATTGALVALLGTVGLFNSETSALEATFSQDGTHIVTDGKDIDIWDAASGRRIASKKFTEDLYSSSIKAISPDGSRVLTSNFSEKSLIVWDIESKKKLMTFDYDVPFRFGPKGRIATVRVEDGFRNIVEIDSGQILSTLPVAASKTLRWSFNDSGTRFIEVDKEQIRVWDVHSGELVMTTNLAGLVQGELRLVFFFENDRILLTDKSGNAILLRDYAADDSVTFNLNAEIRKASISTDGAVLATVDSNNSVRVWNAEKGTLSSTLPELSAAVRGIRLSPDGRRLAVITKHFVNVYVSNPEDLLKLAESRLPANLELPN